MTDLRCPHILFAKLTDDGYLEVKCRSQLCGAAPGVVVLHRFDPLNGALLGTYRYASPDLGEKGTRNDSANPVAVRHS